jgi:flagellar hook protein FlgE
MSFNIGLTGLNAASADLKVTGNNIANSGTVGFKESRAEFSNLFVQSYGSISKTSVGSGAKVAATPQQFTQGSLDYTENVMDMAISGQGFFILDDEGNKAYSRAGAFQVDQDGYVVNSQGMKLQTYPLKDNNFYAINDSTFTEEPARIVPEFNVGQLVNLQLPLENIEPTSTGKTVSNINLRSDAEPILAIDGVTPISFDQNDPDTYNYSTSVTVYDTLGSPRTMTYYFKKEPNPLEWSVYADLEGRIDDTAPLTPITTLVFDANGALTTPTELLEIPFDLALYEPSNGAQIGTVQSTNPTVVNNIISVDFKNMTQFGTQYTVNELSQDGNAVGRLSGLEVDANGIVFSRYTNGQSKALGQVALANFNNPQGLQVMGNNTWIETAESGEHAYDAPGNGELGSIQSGALEASNVDVAEELVNLITAQRNYQANAKTVSTADQMVQTILNLQ